MIFKDKFLIDSQYLRHQLQLLQKRSILEGDCRVRFRLCFSSLFFSRPLPHNNVIQDDSCRCGVVTRLSARARARYKYNRLQIKRSGDRFEIFRLLDVCRTTVVRTGVARARTHLPCTNHLSNGFDDTLRAHVHTRARCSRFKQQVTSERSLMTDPGGASRVRNADTLCKKRYSCRFRRHVPRLLITRREKKGTKPRAISLPPSLSLSLFLVLQVNKNPIAYVFTRSFALASR